MFTSLNMSKILWELKHWNCWTLCLRGCRSKCPSENCNKHLNPTHSRGRGNAKSCVSSRHKRTCMSPMVPMTDCNAHLAFCWSDSSQKPPFWAFLTLQSNNMMSNTCRETAGKGQSPNPFIWQKLLCGTFGLLAVCLGLLHVLVWQHIPFQQKMVLPSFPPVIHPI